MVHGSANSAHMFGRAADFQVIGLSNYEVADFLARKIELLQIDQLIYEFGEWVHVSIPVIGATPRRQVMTAVHNPKTGKTEYSSGIIKQEEK
jgi:hypothetical protein